MTDHSSLDTLSDLPQFEVSESERQSHREFILRHIDFLIDTLTGEQFVRQWKDPCGCPHATPELLAHRKNREGESHSCSYERIETLTDKPESGCVCQDPLAGSDEPLDTVAAVILSQEKEVIDRYFDHTERRLVSRLRDAVGAWEEIYALDTDELYQRCQRLIPARRIDRSQIERLQVALGELLEHRYTDELSLKDLPSVKYDRLKEMFTSLPGISETDAWWLILVALDKPVWPASPEIDQLLVELGLLAPDNLTSERSRHTELEEELTPRQILPLHRALAAHSRYCGPDHRQSSCEIARFTLGYRAQKQTDRQTGLQVVDLFAGAGGLSHGFTQEGFEVALAVDKNRDAMDTFRFNHPEVPHSRVRCEDIHETLDSEVVDEIETDVDVIVGGPPCQGLSVAGYRARRASDEEYSILDDPRNDLYKQYVRILDRLEPTYLVMENVEGLLNEIGETDKRVIEDVENALSEVNYECDYRVIDCSEFGIPQTRKRVVVLGVRRSAVNDPEARIEEMFEQFESEHTQERENDLRRALTNLPRLRRGEGCSVTARRSRGSPSEYVRINGLHTGTRLSYNHQAREHPMDKDQELFDDVMQPGDTGWDVKYRKGRDDLIEYNVGSEDDPAFKDKYRMLYWDQPSPTIVAHLAKDANSFILPDYYEYVQENPEKADNERNRGITPREAARIQSFPDSYVFLGPFTSQFRQIGNAVPPLIGKYLANTIRTHLPDHSEAGSTVTAPERIASTDD